MLAVSDNLAQCFSALRGHKLRASLTMLGLTMGVATLIAVMTIVQGANLYVEQKIANLGTNVFQIARTPFAVTDFNIIIKALKYKKIELEDMAAIAEGCSACEEVGASASTSVRARSGDKELQDVSLYGQTASMADIEENFNVYVHCGGGYRSVIAGSLLKRQGIHNLRNVLGGWNVIKNQHDIQIVKDKSVLN